MIKGRLFKYFIYYGTFNEIGAEIGQGNGIYEFSYELNTFENLKKAEAVILEKCLTSGITLLLKNIQYIDWRWDYE